MMFGFFSKISATENGSAYNYEFVGLDGNSIKLSDYKDNVIVVVNVASRCGYTPQYKDLQYLWSTYKSKNLVVIGVPTNNFRQEPGSNKEIKDFCETNFGINFPMTEKINVKGKDQHPLLNFLTTAHPNHSGTVKWNFTKFLLSKDGEIINRFGPSTKPNSKKVIQAIESAL